MPRINMTVAMLQQMAHEFGPDYAEPDMVLEIEESTGTDAFGMIVRYTGSDGAVRKLLVTPFGRVRIA